MRLTAEHYRMSSENSNNIGPSKLKSNLKKKQKFNKNGKNKPNESIEMNYDIERATKYAAY